MQTRYVNVVLRTLATFVVFILVQSVPAAAKPVIEWSPGSITGAISQGQSSTTTAGFIVSKDISRRVTVRVVPALAPFVRVEPSSFKELVAGETVTVAITFSAQEDAPTGMFEGVIQLRARGTVARPLPINLMIEEGPPGSTVTVVGSVFFDTGEPVAGAQVLGSIASESTLSSLQRALTAEALPADPTSSAFKADPVIVESQSLLFLQAEAQDVVTGPAGEFTLELMITELPAEVLVEVLVQLQGVPEVRTAKLETAEMTLLDLGTIIIPNPLEAELLIIGGSAESADRSIRIDDLPPEVQQLFSRSYDPDQDPEAFPGEFAEMGNVPLNSAVFLWIEALDVDGNSVIELSQPVTIRTFVPTSQWGDLEDINFGTDRIEIPIYIYNELSNMWEQQGTGWLEDGVGTVLPEDAQSVILDGTFSGDIFATFVTNHFTWLNVDYPFIGPWTLSRAGLDSDKRNNDCFFRAAELAKVIALSPEGVAAYQKVNNPGADLTKELADGQGPEIENSIIADDSEGNPVRGIYHGGDSFILHDGAWSNCDTPERKDDTTLCLAIHILHETAHWKDHVLHTAGNTPGEEGWQLTMDLFAGGLPQCRDGVLEFAIPKEGGGWNIIPVGDSVKERWLDPEFWTNRPAPTGAQQEAAEIALAAGLLQLDVTVIESGALGDPVIVDVTLSNQGTGPIEVYNRFLFEDYPLRFEITNTDSGEPVAFMGPEFTLILSSEDFQVLNHGESLTRRFDLTSLNDGGARYNFIASGQHSIVVEYDGFFGLPRTASAPVIFTLDPGASASGMVSDASGGLPISGASVKAIRDGNTLATESTDASGNYAFPELPPGVYTFEAMASGFLRSSQDNVQLVVDQNTEVNFSLSTLLSFGEVRLVLTWGEQPEDLDAHLWLPPETPFQVSFGRKGSLDTCPFAELDTDDTSSFGPETFTISERFEGTYQYAVFNFSDSPELTDSQAQVQVFDPSGLLTTFNVPTDGAGRWWNVLTIDGATGAITEINELSDADPSPYLDTDAGCASQ
jgi:hypothetical protein